MRHASLADLPCPIARTLDVVGEWWSLLIVRDALFGARRFDDFKSTGIADNILARRLKTLVEAGIFEQRLYQSRPARSEYLLTDKGRQLAPVVAALRQWGAAWTTGDDHNPRLLHAVCGHDTAVAVVCPTCERPVPAQELVRTAEDREAPLGQGLSAGREADRASQRGRARSGTGSPTASGRRDARSLETAEPAPGRASAGGPLEPSQLGGARRR